MTLPELRKEKTDIELSEEKLISERDALMMKLNVQHDVSAKIDLFTETCHKFLSKINDPKIVTERLKKDIIKLVIDEVVIEGESVKIFATIPLPNKIHEREMDKTDIPGTFNAGATLGPVNETNMARIWNKHKQSNTPLKRKVFVGLSGGVDSAVSAALLKRAGYNVTGVFIKVWQPDFMPCTWREERRDAMRVAIALDIPFLFFDFETEYKKGVVDKMIDEYKRGRTPNPDVLCNKEVKFGSFWKKAKELGADFIATGHYANVTTSSGEFQLKEGKDKEKDQSYFLWTIKQEDLEHILFPVGNLLKSAVRKLAHEFKLPVADKKDSQGICFIGDVTMEEFLTHFISVKMGKVLNLEGEVVGTHRGAIYYTIGERRGFEVTKKDSDAGAYYIVSKDIEANTITVSNKEKEIVAKSPKKVSIKNVNWITEPPGPKIQARIRYRGEKLPVTLALAGKTLAVEFANPVRGLSLGQSIVFYLSSSKTDQDVCLGGGVMDKVL